MARTLEFNVEEVIAKAMNVFWTKGYNRASMRNLTMAMQINSSLYNKLVDKQPLFRKCTRWYTRSHMQAIQVLAAAAESPQQATAAAIRDSADYSVHGDNSRLDIKIHL